MFLPNSFLGFFAFKIFWTSKMKCTFPVSMYWSRAVIQCVREWTWTWHTTRFSSPSSSLHLHILQFMILINLKALFYILKAARIHAIKSLSVPEIRNSKFFLFSIIMLYTCLQITPKFITSSINVFISPTSRT